MNIANRIQQLRKEKGISQDQLANEVGVSRQAVSKWESQQSLPDLEKIIILSEYFSVSTDYLIKGTEEEKKDTTTIISKVLYISSTVIIALGIIIAFASWYENQNMEDIAGAFIIQAIGIVGYFTGTILSSSKPMFLVKWLNIIMIIFIPLSLLLTTIFDGAPGVYPSNLLDTGFFIVLYIPLCIFLCFLLKRKSNT